MLSDKQLMLLEQLAYIHDPIDGAADAVFSAAGVPAPDSDKNIADIVNLYDEAALDQLEGQELGYTSGAEWAAIIRAIQGDEDLMSLKSGAMSDPETGIYCYMDPAEPDRAIVIFAGTRDGWEWDDNVKGLNAVETEDQKDALRYLEGLPYEKISVVGHSKGGNKAQYVTLLDDRVDQCVSMDGQGFSQEFLDEYWAEIQSRGFLINNYSLRNDYVNILLFPVPGSNQQYFKGNDGQYGAKNHAPGCFFQYIKDAEGNWQIILDEAGELKLRSAQQAFGMNCLHEFTCFILNYASPADKEAIIAYLGPLLGLIMDSDRQNYAIEVDGVIYTHENWQLYLKRNPETLGMVIAYFAKYVTTRGLSPLEIENLLYEFGLGDMMLKIKALIAAFPTLSAIAGGTVGGLLLFLFAQLVDGKKDPFLSAVLRVLDSLLGESFGMRLSELWTAADSAYNRMGSANVFTVLQDGKARGNKILDYREETYEKIMSVMHRIDSQLCGTVGNWTSYSEEKWYNSLLVGNMISGVNLYLEHLLSVNTQCREQITRIFEEVRRIDQQKAARVDELGAITERVGSTVAQITASLG